MALFISPKVCTLYEQCNEHTVMQNKIADFITEKKFEAITSDKCNYFVATSA